jgi:hypothetical protein
MTTKREDAESIIDDEEVIKALELKSTTENNVLVIKADESVDKMEHDEECEEGDEECMKKHKKDMKKEMSVVENTVVSPAPEPVLAELTPVEKSIAALKARVEAIKSQGLTGDNALAELQKNFDELGSVVKAEFAVKLSPEEVVKQNLAEIVRSTIQEMLPQALSQIAPNQAKIEAMQSELVELRALTQKTPIKKEEMPIQRSLNVNLVQKAAIERLVAKSKSQAQQIAEASVGL